jgi:hypothetical protein
MGEKIDKLFHKFFGCVWKNHSIKGKAICRVCNRIEDIEKV